MLYFFHTLGGGGGCGSESVEISTRFPYRTNVKKIMSVLYFTVQWDCLHCASLCSVIASLCTEYRVSK